MHHHTLNRFPPGYENAAPAEAAPAEKAPESAPAGTSAASEMSVELFREIDFSKEAEKEKLHFITPYNA